MILTDREKEYVEKFRELKEEKRKSILLKICNKYSSKEYINREVRIGRTTPNFYLEYLLMYYGFKYGELIDDPSLLDDYFGEEKYLLDDTIYVSFIYTIGEDIFTIAKK